MASARHSWLENDILSIRALFNPGQKLAVELRQRCIEINPWRRCRRVKHTPCRLGGRVTKLTLEHATEVARVLESSIARRLLDAPTVPQRRGGVQKANLQKPVSRRGRRALAEMTLQLAQRAATQTR